MSDELWRHGATELAALIASGRVTSREVVDAHLGRIDQVNGAVNAVVRRMDEQAREAADDADRRRAAGEPLGPLHGVPFTVKENIDVAGTPTTSSVPALAEAISPTDAPVVERMRAAGGIVLARTNLPDFGLRVFTESSLHGITRNPWNGDRTAGGSSGGEAAALATGMSPIGLGNDLGGSLRNPAHCCGIASIKPSTGVVPSATSIPPTEIPLMYQLMAVEGVMARRVADVRAGLHVVAGPHLRDPLALPVGLSGLDRSRPARVAVAAAPPGGSTHPGVEAAIRRVADRLSDAGAVVEEACPDTYERSLELWANMLMADVRPQMPLLEMVMGEDALTFLGYADEIVPPIDMASFGAMAMERLAVLKQWQAFLDTYDVLLTPVWSQPPPVHGADVVSLEAGQATLDMMRPVLPANLLGLPAAVVPAGFADGLPVGAQLTAARFADLRALDVAQMIEDLVGVQTPIDPR
jgi:amidase